MPSWTLLRKRTCSVLSWFIQVTYIKSVAVSSTMGPGVDIDPNALRVTDEDLASV